MRVVGLVRGMALHTRDAHCLRWRLRLDDSAAYVVDAAIGRLPAPYFPGGRHGQQFQMKQKNTIKTQLLPSFLTVDLCKKDKQFWDPKRAIYSRH
jgi:hypothetical protein